MENLKLRDIVKYLNIDTDITDIDDDIIIKSICTDTRKIVSECLFIAIKGENFDGHDYIEKAFELGAVAALSSKDIILKNKFVFRVEDTRDAYLNLSNYYRRLLDVFIVGVTGSVGKTSTKDMIYGVLSEFKKTLKTQGNLNNEIGVPTTLFQLDSSYKYCVIEMGMSNLLEISKLSKAVLPNISVITNIGLSHMETLGSIENILKAKLEILDGMNNNDILIINADDKMLFGCKDKISNPILSYGIDNPKSNIIASDIVQNKNNTSFVIHYNNDKYNISIPCLGKHNILNALAAFCVGICLKIDIEIILRGLKNYTPSLLRQEINEINGITFIKDCYNANPDSMIAALNVLDSLECKGKKIAVLGDMLELGDISAEEHFNIGKYASSLNVDVLLFCGKNSKNMLLGARNNKFYNCYHYEDIDKLYNKINSELKVDDIILFKASRGIKLENVIDKIYKESILLCQD